MEKLRNFFLLTLFSLLFFSSNLFLNEKSFASNSSFEIIPEKVSIFNENEIYLIVKFDLEKNWHTYWKNPGDSGEPASFEWDLPEGFEISEAMWPTPELIPYPPLTTFGYTDQLELLFKLSLPEEVKENSVIAVSSKWLVCADVCIPQEGSVSFDLFKANQTYPSQIGQLLSKIKQKIPLDNGKIITSKIEEDRLVLNLEELGLDITDAYFFPFRKDVIDYSVNQKLKKNDEEVSLSLAFIENTDVSLIKGGILKTNAGSQELRLLQRNFQSEVSLRPEFISLMTAILFSLIGGLLLNLMPCVFPVISLKILNFVNHSENRSQTSLHGMFFSLGAILMFVLIGLSVLVLKSIGMDVGWGYQLQSPIVVSLLIFLFIFLAGFFLLNVNFFNTLLSIGTTGLKAPNYVNSFATGFLAVIVATPCTAPFMGSALGFAILQPGFSSFLIFLALGIGFTFPYILLSIFPGLVSILPKPGQWMETFKQFMAFPMMLTALWLIWVLSSQISSFQLILVLLGISLIVFFYWLNQLNITSATGKRFRVFVYLFIFVSIFLTLPTQNISTQENTNVFSEAELNKKLEQGPVFLNFTADWCITCKVNERVALKTKNTLNLFKEKEIFYMEADWTNKNKVIAEKLESFGRSSIPLYVFYPERDKQPIILPEILSESVIEDYLN